MLRSFHTSLTMVLLLCLYSAFAHSLDAGFASADITPDVVAHQVPMAGYGARQGKPSTGVHDTLRAKVMYVRDTNASFAIITCDLRSVTPELKQLVVDKAPGLGLTTANVMLSASHTHSGPSIFREKFWKVQFGAFDPAILDGMSTAIADALKKSVASAAPVRVGFGSGKVEGFTENRRWEYDTEARVKAGETPALNPVVSVIRFDRIDGTCAGLFVNFATHPTILPAGNMQISADWPGVLQARLEEAFPGAVAMFANGAEGDQAPTGDKGTDDFAKVDDFGSRLAREVQRIAGDVKTEPNLAAASVQIMPALPEVVFSPGALRGPYSQMGPMAIEALPKRAEIQAFCIGTTAIVTMPGEPICEVGLDAQKRLAALGFAQSIVVGLANDYIGYIVNEKEYAHAGYEVDSRSYYGAGLGALIAEQVGEAAKQLK